MSGLFVENVVNIFIKDGYWTSNRMNIPQNTEAVLFNMSRKYISTSAEKSLTSTAYWWSA